MLLAVIILMLSISLQQIQTSISTLHKDAHIKQVNTYQFLFGVTRGYRLIECRVVRVISGQGVRGC